MGQEPGEEKLIIGTKVTPPFVMEAPDGALRGISIDLWEIVAEELELDYEFRRYDLQGLLNAVKTGEVDAGVAALTITGEREELMDFSHPFYTTGFGIAVGGIEEQTPWSLVMNRVASKGFLSRLGTMLLVLFVVGTLAWMAEARANPEQFGGGILRGIGSGFWWPGLRSPRLDMATRHPRPC